jgi:hypothetical protein
VVLVEVVPVDVLPVLVDVEVDDADVVDEADDEEDCELDVVVDACTVRSGIAAMPMTGALRCAPAMLPISSASPKL